MNLVIFSSYVLTILSVQNVFSFNLESGQAFQYSIGKNGYYFGYSLAFHKSGQSSWILVGAPMSSESGNLTQSEVGALYRCDGRQGGNCTNLAIDDKLPNAATETTKGQWLGSTVASQGKDQKVAVCAPRYGQYQTYHYAHGRCFILDKDLKVEKEWDPYRSKENLWNFQERWGLYGQCELGFSLAFGQTEDKPMLSGLVGYYNNRGLIMSTNINAFSVQIRFINKVSDPDELWGYSVTWANITGSASGEIVGGAPRGNNLKGKVIWYKDKELLKTKNVIENPDGQTGAYFGSAVVAVDLNGDGFDEIIVGAPFHSSAVQEGRVYVFINNAGGGIDPNGKSLTPEKNENALFGSSMAAVGDLNLDNYEDIAIGAPYGGPDGKGTVYIYHGGPNGLANNFEPVQIILASDVPGAPSSFGASLTGGMDLDGDNNLDIAVGSFQSDMIHLIRGRPIIIHSMQFKLNSTKVLISNSLTGCIGPDGLQYTCIYAEICLSYKGENLPNQLDLQLKLEFDKNSLEKRAFVFDPNKKRIAVLLKVMNMNIDLEKCNNTLFYVTDRTIDFANSIVVSSELSYAEPLGGCGGLCPIIDFYSSKSSQQQITYLKGCGEDNQCDTDLSLTGSISLPANETQLVFGRVKDFSLNIFVNNSGENAILSTLEVTMGNDINVNGVDLETGKNVLFEEKSLLPDKRLLTFEISKVFKENSGINVTVRLSLSQTQPTGNEYTFIVEAKTVSQDTNYSNNKLLLNVTAKSLACIRISGSAPKKIYYTNEYLKPLPYGIETDIGPEVNITFLIQNQGPSTVKKLEVNINIAYQLKDSNYVVYLLESTSDAMCALDANPENITLLNDVVRNETDPNNRKRRDIETIGCQNGRCTDIKCIVGQLQIGKARTVTIRARIWKRTFVEVLKKETSIYNRITLIIPDEEKEILQHEEGCAQDQDIAEFTFNVAAEDVKKTSKESVPWWIILVSVIAGLILICGTIAVFYKFGFFERKRVIKEISKPVNEDEDEG